MKASKAGSVLRNLATNVKYTRGVCFLYSHQDAALVAQWWIITLRAYCFFTLFHHVFSNMLLKATMGNKSLAVLKSED